MDIRRCNEWTKLEYDFIGLTVDWTLIFMDPRAQLSLRVTPGLPQLHHMDAVGQVMSPGWYPPNPLQDKRFYLTFISPKTRFSHSLRDFHVSLTEEKLLPGPSARKLRWVEMHCCPAELFSWDCSFWSDFQFRDQSQLCQPSSMWDSWRLCYGEPSVQMKRLGSFL